MSPIDECCDVRVFFQDRLQTAFASQRTEASGDTQVYLLGLLADTACSQSEPPVDSPLVTLLESAHAAEGARRLAGFRKLGDAALMLYGFFSDATTRRGISDSYVRSMGSCGYASASSLIRTGTSGTGIGLAAVYRELSLRFEELGEVLANVRDQTPISVAEQVRLYERWSTTGSRRLARRLVRNGMAPVMAAPANSSN